MGLLPFSEIVAVVCPATGNGTCTGTGDGTWGASSLSGGASSFTTVGTWRHASGSTHSSSNSGAGCGGGDFCGEKLRSAWAATVARTSSMMRESSTELGSSSRATSNAARASSCRASPSSAAPLHACPRGQVGRIAMQFSASSSDPAQLPTCAKAEERFERSTGCSAFSWSRWSPIVYHCTASVSCSEASAELPLRLHCSAFASSTDAFSGDPPTSAIPYSSGDPQALRGNSDVSGGGRR
mmetsp:Transcript_19171/g.44565  ORF Transcript_19171/g.44565 Transcript_19171/m.44565 type:complete len:240 (+) Transcript_19171:1595-2314(+)